MPIRSLFFFALLITASLVQAQQPLTGSLSDSLRGPDGSWSHRARTLLPDDPSRDWTSRPMPLRRPAETLDGAVLRWMITDSMPIVDRDAILSANGDNLVMGYNLNDQRLAYYRQDTSAALWEYPTGTDMRCDLARYGQNILMATAETLFYFGTTEPVPLWTHLLTEFDTTARGATVSLSDDGLLGLLGIYTTGNHRIVLMNALTNVVLWSDTLNPATAGGLVAVKIPRQKNRVLVTCRNEVFLYDVRSGRQVWSGPAGNTESPAAISDNADVIAVASLTGGKLSVFGFDEVDSTYRILWRYAFPRDQDSWCTSVAVSGDGSTIIAGSLKFYTSGEVSGAVGMFDTDSRGEPRWLWDLMGDYVDDVALSADGRYGVAVGWGDFADDLDDICIFNRMNVDPIYGYSTPGSMNTCDISRNGRFVVVGGKLTHAREFGRGTQVYLLEVQPTGGTVTGTCTIAGASDHSDVVVSVVGTDYTALSSMVGGFILSNVPAGTYRVEARKRGYSCDPIDGVVVRDGVTTSGLTFVLHAGASAPTALAASTDHVDDITLNWSATGSPSGFRVYRSLVPHAHYVFLDSVPGSARTYRDTLGLYPRSDYHYVVAASDGRGESVFSNDALGRLDDSYMLDSLWAPILPTMPVFDGIFSPGEWDAALRFDISDVFGMYDALCDPPGTAFLWLGADTTRDLLLIAYEDFRDTTAGDNEGLGIYCDDRHDGRWPDYADPWQEGNFWAYHFAGGPGLYFRSLYGYGGARDAVAVPTGRQGVDYSTGHLRGEVALQLSWRSGNDIQLYGPGRTVGIGFFIANREVVGVDTLFFMHGWWPQQMEEIVTSVNQFGPLTIPVPLIAPPLPPSATAYADSARTRLLSWTLPDSGIDGFPLTLPSQALIYRNENFLQMPAVGVETYRDRRLVPGGWYGYRLSAMVSEGASGYEGPRGEPFGGFTFPAPELFPLVYTDSTAEANYVVGFSWDDNRFAVRFTPPSWPVRVFRVGGWFAASDSVWWSVHADSAGLPGRMVAGPYGWIVPTASQWVYYTLPADEPPEFGSGDFWVELRYTASAPYSPPVGADFTAPIDGRSWQYTTTTGWTAMTSLDLMIEADYALGSGVQDASPTVQPPGIAVTPQPVREAGFVCISGSVPGQAIRIELGDLLGRTLAIFHGTADVNGEWIFPIHPSELKLSAGCYVLQLGNGSGIHFVVE